MRAFTALFYLASAATMFQQATATLGDVKKLVWRQHLDDGAGYLYIVLKGKHAANRAEAIKALEHLWETRTEVAGAKPNAIIIVNDVEGTVFASTNQGLPAGRSARAGTDHLMFRGQKLCEQHEKCANCAECSAVATLIREKWEESDKGANPEMWSIPWVNGAEAPPCSSHTEGQIGCIDWCPKINLKSWPANKRRDVFPLHARDFTAMGEDGSCGDSAF